MGVYDILPGGQQVKLWNNEFQDIEVGDRVPEIGEKEETYSVVLREGGYAHIAEGIFRGVFEIPQQGYPIVDKWGSPWTPETKGELDGVGGIKDPYFYSK